MLHLRRFAEMLGLRKLVVCCVSSVVALLPVELQICELVKHQRLALRVDRELALHFLNLLGLVLEESEVIEIVTLVAVALDRTCGVVAQAFLRLELVSSRCIV